MGARNRILWGLALGLPLAAGSVAAQPAIETALPRARQEPVFAPKTVNFFGDVDVYDLKDSRPTYRRRDDITQGQAGVAIRVAPSASITLGGNYGELRGVKTGPTLGRYNQEGGSLFGGGTYYFAHNYNIGAVAGLVRDTISETDEGPGRVVSDRRRLKGGFISAGVEANYPFDDARLNLFARALYYDGAEAASVRSDGSIRARYPDTFTRLSFGGEVYKRAHIGGLTLEPMVRAALLYDARLQRGYTDRTAFEIGGGVNAPFGSNTLSFKVLWTSGRRDYKGVNYRLSLYHQF